MAEDASYHAGMERFNEAALVSHLDALKPKERAAFALACVRRLVPSIRTDQQTVGLVRACLELLEASLVDDAAPRQALNEALARLEKSPKLDDDAVASARFALRARLRGASQDAAWAARRAYDARDQRVWDELGLKFSDPGAEAQVLANPLIQLELHAQRQDIEALSAGRFSTVLLGR